MVRLQVDYNARQRPGDRKSSARGEPLYPATAGSGKQRRVSFTYLPCYRMSSTSIRSRKCTDMLQGR